MTVQTARALRAFLLVGFMVAVCALAGLREAAADADNSAALAAAPSAQSIAERAASYAADAPAWLEAELFAVGDVERAYAEADGKVYGFVAKRASGEWFEAACAEMQDKGWTRTESGIGCCATFVRDGGDCRWAMLSCLQVGESSTMVVQLR